MFEYFLSVFRQEDTPLLPAVDEVLIGEEKEMFSVIKAHVLLRVKCLESAVNSTTIK